MGFATRHSIILGDGYYIYGVMDSNNTPRRKGKGSDGQVVSASSRNRIDTHGQLGFWLCQIWGSCLKMRIGDF